jgi:hypothetical protein
MLNVRNRITLVAIIALLFFSTSAHAVGIIWSLNGVTLDDGGTATGTFVFNADTSTVSNWNVSVSGGDTGTFSPFTYSTGSSSFFFTIATWSPLDTFNFEENSSNRELRLTPIASLTNAGGTVPIDLATSSGGSGAVECFNCSPFRVIDAGSLVSVCIDPDEDGICGSIQTAVPTMTEWGMIIFMVLAGIGSIYYMRRKKITG